MNRIIKFRAWDDANKIMEYNPFVAMKKTDEQKEVYFNCVFGRTDLNYVFLQFTGLTDKNGVEIYEGDIVSYDEPSYGLVKTKYHRVGTVEYREDLARFDIKLKNLFDGGSAIEMKEIYPIEVIGNVFENENLLK